VENCGELVSELIFISTTVDRGGAEILLLGMVKALRSEYKITVFYMIGKGSLRPNLQALGVEVKQLGLRSILRVLHSLWKNREAILQGWMYHGNIIASLFHILALGRGKLFWAVHHSAKAYARESLGKKMILKLSAFLSRMPAGIVYVSEPVQEEHNKFGYRNKNTKVIHNGIDTTQFIIDDTANERIRSELGIPSDASVLGIVGRNHPVKDYKTFFRAVAILLQTHPQLHVVTVGRDINLNEFSSQLKDLSPQNLARIHLLGERTDVPQLLSIMDVFVLSSLSESFSLSLIEALATGRCCVSTDVVFFWDLFPEALLTFKPNNYKALVEGVNRHLSLSSEQRQLIGSKARTVVEDRFTMPGMIKSYQEFWDQRVSGIKEDFKPSRRKVLRLISRLNVGGPAIHVILLTRHFNNESWESVLVTGIPGENEGDMGYLARKYGVEPVIFNNLGREISILDDLKVGLELIKLFRKEKPDIVHTHTAKAGTLGRLAAIITCVPQIYHTFHGHVFQGYFSPLKTRIFLMIERFLARFTTGIIAISKRQKDDLIKFGITQANKIHVIPLGFDFSRILPPDQDRMLRRMLNIAPGKITVALIGRITAIKNPILFMNIAGEVIRQRQNVHFLVIGDGELKQDCQHLAKKLGIQDQVSFTGFISDLMQIYGSVDIVCLTSINEGTPVSLLEAMACQKIVISTPVGGVPDFIRTGENGFICEADPVAFSNQIIDCVDNLGKYTTLREQAAKDVLNRYDMSRLFKDIEELYDLHAK
jgi:glycosyltransferase involved in cell wall biosynthesis